MPDKKRILLVDDSATVLMMEKMLLKDSGFEIITAKNGREGVETAVAKKPDLILMDLVMPELDGISAVKALRGHTETSAIPIIMVTTRSEADKVQAGFESGCNDYVTKPINGVELMLKIRSLLTPPQA